MTPWAALYLLTQVTLALGVGGLFLRMPRALPLPRIARFFAGLSLAPFVSGLWVMGCAALWPGLPQAVMVAGLVLAALLLALGTFRRAPRRLWRAWRRTPMLAGGTLTLALVYGLLAVAMTLLAARLWSNGLQPLAAHDVLNYASEALYFLRERSSAGMLAMSDAADGSVRGSTHGFVFSALLAAALCFTDGVAGHGQDLAARFALQTTFPAMLCALLALTALLRRRGAGALAVLMLLGVPHFEYVSYAASRDAFRIVPLLLLTALLSALPVRRLRISTLLLVAGSAALALSAHTLNVMVIAAVTTMGGLIMLLQGRPVSRVVAVLVAVGGGVVLAGERYVASYLATGQLWGELPARYALAGTPLAGAWQHLDRYADSHAMGAAHKVLALLSRDHGFLSGAGLLAALLLLLCGARDGRRNHPPLLWAACCVALVAPLSGLFDIEPYRLSDWFVENLRYALHGYPLLAATLVAALLLPGARTPRAARATTVVTLVLVLAYGALAVHSLWHWRGDAARLASTRALDTQLELLNRLEAALPQGQRLCLDDFGYNYYLDNRALILGARASWPILRAADAAEATARFDALGIGAVVLKKSSIPAWWERLPFHAALSAAGDWQIVGETRLMIAYARRAAVASRP